jgi:hypothetical protein
MRDRDGDRERRSPYLPTGFRLDELAERDFVVLRKPDGSEAAWPLRPPGRGPGPRPGPRPDHSDLMQATAALKTWQLDKRQRI